MQRLNPPADLAERPPLLQGMAIMAVGGWVVFTVCILVADFVVPDHDWIADTISDLGAGELDAQGQHRARHRQGHRRRRRGSPSP
jgi:hypothetical protein